MEENFSHVLLQRHKVDSCMEPIFSKLSLFSKSFGDLAMQDVPLTHTDSLSDDGHTSVYSSDNEIDSKDSTSFKKQMAISATVGNDVFDVSHHGSIFKFISARIEQGNESGSFLVTNLASVVRQYYQWLEELPMVTPFYAVKCNPDAAVVRLLASLGCCFDCATMGEIQLVLDGLGQHSFRSRGNAASSIVYANPAKMEHMLDYALNNGVRMTVFDGEDELYKIASLENSDQFQLLLRLTTDDSASICRFSKKFGCPVAESRHLLEVAKSLGLNVVGVSFHVGSGCGDPQAYRTALEHARRVFDNAIELGMPPLSLVDLGGGFPGDTVTLGPGMPTFQELAAAIRQGLQQYFFSDAQYTGIRVIAEPGRYFVSASTVITTKVYSRKGGKADYQALYVDDGVYGSFNNVVYDHACPIPAKLSKILAAEDDNSFDSVVEEKIPTAVFGPTCDGLDQMCSLDSTLLERCQVNEWLVWENQGAYTHTASFVFNGYTHVPKKTYCWF